MFNFLALLDIRVLVAYITIVTSDWPRTFFTPKVFLFSINYTDFIRVYKLRIIGKIYNVH